MELRGARLIPAPLDKTWQFEANLLASQAGAPLPVAPPAAARNNTLWWVIGAVVVLAAIYLLAR